MAGKIRALILSLALAGAGAGAAAEAAEPAGPEKRLEAEYTVTWLGFPVYSGRLDIVWNGERYRMRFRAEAEGIVRLAAHTDIAWETTGRFAKGAVRPDRFEQSNTFRRKTRRITLAYAGRGPPAVSVVPPESPGKRPPVPEPMKSGTLDPLSAAFAALTLPRDAKGCGYSAQVFEGLRRTDVRLEYGGTERTPVHRVAGLDRRAFVCLMHARRLAGYEEKHFRENPEPLPPATLWVAKHDEAGLWLLAQLRFESQFGPIYARLTRIALTNGGGR
ncbi:MAG TPA: DUF3108 domain-containing protein [Alphaproteobacteria bacterium]|jgi:hypothetical protein